MGGRSGAKRRRAGDGSSPRALSAAELRALFESGPALSAAVDPQGRILYCSPALSELLGDPIARGATPLARLIRSEAPGGRLPDAITRATVDGVPSAIDAWIRGPDGSPRLLEARVVPLSDGGDRIAAVHLDRLEDEALPSHPAHISTRASRAAFIQRIARSIARAGYDTAYQFAILLVDIDNFELVDHSLGSVRADEFLGAVEHRLQGSLRPRDQVTHLGGHEFGIVIDDLPDPDSAARVAERLQGALREPFRLEGQEVFSSVSIGIAASGRQYAQPQEALRDAGTALARARSLGPGRVELFDLEMRGRAIARLRLETDLRRAVARGEFFLHYQPELSLSTGDVVGFEALIRWQHPQRGVVSPGQFIPVAEQTRLIIPMTEWVLQEACRQLRAWQQRFTRKPPLAVAVNLAPLLLAESLVLPALNASIEQSGLDAGSMIVEITENALMTDFQQASTQLSALREKGVRVHLDDFGTGFSSLGYLSRLPADAVKIDRSFVGRMGEDAEAETMVGAIIELAHRMGKSVVAEGIEEADQAERLRALGCEVGQGYLFARPMADSHATEWLAAPRTGGAGPASASPG